MTLVPFPSGLWWPYARLAAFSNGATATLDAATEKFAFIGRLVLPARTGSKTLDTSGLSKIGFQCSTVTFANVASSLDVGIQGVNTSGPVAQPDGVYSVKAVVSIVAPTAPPLATNAWCEAVPTIGSVTLNHGDLIAVVVDLTARGGADSILMLAGNAGSTFPTTNAFAAAAWGAVGVGATPNAVITFSDGTVGFIDGCTVVGISAPRTWTDATNPDERGTIFQVPFPCKIDALGCAMRTADANGDFIISLYSDPLGAPAIMGGGTATLTIDAAQLGPINAENIAVFQLPSEVQLAKNTDYCVAVKASGAGNIRWNEATLGNGAHRAMFPGTTTIFSATRNGGAGAFASASSTLMHPTFARISQLDDGRSPRAQSMIGM